MSGSGYLKFRNDRGVPEICIGVREFECIGVSPPQDHPHIYINMGEVDTILCPYCGTRFRFDPRLTPLDAIRRTVSLLKMARSTRTDRRIPWPLAAAERCNRRGWWQQSRGHTGSHPTLRWREPDSNRRSRSGNRSFRGYRFRCSDGKGLRPGGRCGLRGGSCGIPVRCRMPASIAVGNSRRLSRDDRAASPCRSVSIRR